MWPPADCVYSMLVRSMGKTGAPIRLICRRDHLHDQVTTWPSDPSQTRLVEVMHRMDHHSK